MAIGQHPELWIETGFGSVLHQPSLQPVHRGQRSSFGGTPSKIVLALLSENPCLHFNPAHHALHEFDGITRELYVSKPNGRGGMTRPLTYLIGLNIEAAMAFAEIKFELVCPLITSIFPPGTHNYDPKRHNLIEGVSKCMITRHKAQAKFNEYHEAQGSHDGSIYWWLQDECESRCSGSHQPSFLGWWENLLSSVLKTARQQHHLCCWGYSHHTGTELLLLHGPSSPRCSSLLWLNVLLAGNRGRRYWESFYLPYHEPLCLLSDKGSSVRFCWIPSHCGIKGNESTS